MRATLDLGCEVKPQGECRDYIKIKFLIFNLFFYVLFIQVFWLSQPGAPNYTSLPRGRTQPTSTDFRDVFLLLRAQPLLSDQ